MATDSPQDMSQPAQMSQHTTKMLFHFVVRNSGLSRLPMELVDTIYSLVLATPSRYDPPAPVIDEPNGPRGDPTKPPPNGACPLLKLPLELCRMIFSSSIIQKDKVIKPRCEEDASSGRYKYKSPKHNQTSDLMVLCKKMKNEVTNTVYGERIFEIHVHEGMASGGIEFLDEPRQLLQYLSEDYGIDTRFKRFGYGEEFGFDRLKKINVVIYPKTSRRQERHTAMHTYFMNLSLAQMLQRGCDKDCDRIVSFNISFNCPASARDAHDVTGRRAIMQKESLWWDALQQQPLSSEIHGMSDIELMLRPFSILRKVHNVNITLPPKIAEDAKTTQFVQDLKDTMTGSEKEGLLMQDGSFESKANAIKMDLFDSSFREQFGAGGDEIGDLDEKDMQDGREDDGNHPHKHDLSPTEDSFDAKRRALGFPPDAHFFGQYPGDDDYYDDNDDADSGVEWNGKQTPKKSKGKIRPSLASNFPDPAEIVPGRLRSRSRRQDTTSSLPPPSFSSHLQSLFNGQAAGNTSGPSTGLFPSSTSRVWNEPPSYMPSADTPTPTAPPLYPWSSYYRLPVPTPSFLARSSQANFSPFGPTQLDRSHSGYQSFQGMPGHAGDQDGAEQTALPPASIACQACGTRVADRDGLWDHKVHCKLHRAALLDKHR